MRKIIFFLFLFFLLVLQLTIMPRLSILGVSANVLVAAFLALVVLRGNKSFLFFALISGLMLDLFSGLPFGVYSLSLIFLTWLILFAGKDFFKATDFSGRISLIACGCLAYALLVLFLTKVFYWLRLGVEMSFWGNLVKVGLIEAGLNIFVALCFLLIFQKIYGLSAKIQR